VLQKRQQDKKKMLQAVDQLKKSRPRKSYTYTLRAETFVFSGFWTWGRYKKLPGNVSNETSFIP